MGIPKNKEELIEEINSSFSKLMLDLERINEDNSEIKTLE
jgi:hypothetical protein